MNDIHWDIDRLIHRLDIRSGDRIVVRGCRKGGGVIYRVSTIVWVLACVLFIVAIPVVVIMRWRMK